VRARAREKTSRARREPACFLIEDGETIRAAWMLGSELPDFDAVIVAAGDLSS
jgi:hypothetical protein